MSASEITVLRDVNVRVPARPSGNCLPFQELRHQIIKGKGAKHLFAYGRATLYTYRIELMNKPLNTAILLRLLSRGECTFEDETGRVEKVGIKLFLSLFAQLLRDFVSKRKILREVGAEVESLMNGELRPQRRNIVTKAPPLYLRTDLVYGLQSGGSVGHIAGVLNNLQKFTAPPIFITTDRIPTVDESIETHVIHPSGRFRDFRELPSIEFNRALAGRVNAELGRRCPAFVYQRYSVNNYTGLKVARSFRVPLIIEYNGPEVWVHRNWGQPLQYEGLSARIERLNLIAAHLVVVVSKAVRDGLLSNGIESEKILVNPNGVDPHRYSPEIDGSKVRERYALNGKTVLGYIGTFGQWHGAEILAEAFGYLLNAYPQYRNGVRLLMIGDGVTMPEVKRRLTHFAAEDATILTGAIPQENGPEYLAACDILVSPHVPNVDGTPFFGSPTKLFEYMAMGKGIVASNLDQIGEVLSHDMTAWLVEPGNSKSLSEGLLVLIDDKARRERLGIAARHTVVSRFTWEAHTARIINKLEEVCR